MTYFANLTAKLFAGVLLISDEQKESLKQYILSALMPDGSFCGRGQSGDLYYTSFALRGLFLLGGLDSTLLQKIIRYLESIKRQPLRPADLTSLIIAESIVHLVQDTVFTGQDIDLYTDRWNTFRQADGCFAASENTAYSSTYTTFLAAASFELLGCEDLCQSIPLAPIVRRQRDSGGFTELPPLKESGTNPTAAAVALFTIRNDDNYNDKAVRTFLSDRQLPSGGFQAHARIPVADLLSTFSATVALHDLDKIDSGSTDCIGTSARNYSDRHSSTRKFVQGLRCPSGGYYGFAGDTRSDAEYTFYAMTLENWSQDD